MDSHHIKDKLPRGRGEIAAERGRAGTNANLTANASKFVLILSAMSYVIDFILHNSIYAVQNKGEDKSIDNANITPCFT